MQVLIQNLSHTCTSIPHDFLARPVQDSRDSAYFLTQRNVEESGIICVDRERYIGLDLSQDGVFRKIFESQSHYVRRWTDFDRDLTLFDILQFLAILLVIQTAQRH